MSGACEKDAPWAPPLGGVPLKRLYLPLYIWPGITEIPQEDLKDVGVSGPPVATGTQMD